MKLGADRDRWSEEERGHLTAKLWLFLLSAGGRWMSGDVARETGCDGSQVCWMLAAMVRAGNTRKFAVEGSRSRFAYGVTGACKVPRCVTTGQIIDCLTQQPEELPA